MNLGFKEGREVVMVQLGQDIHTVYPQDYSGRDLSTLPIMKNVHNYQDLPILINISAGYPGTKGGCSRCAAATAFRSWPAALPCRRPSTTPTCKAVSSPDSSVGWPERPSTSVWSVGPPPRAQDGRPVSSVTSRSSCSSCWGTSSTS
ncbi:MAG: hypothetical protein R3E12_17540 [Candidatus Eisenbacteria bacterium]